ncbi:S8 family serine peptidase [Salinarimonas sp.]|uniref:S8 family serine peptidase n=1 Tax=Salinarimonas sp. TaxID=2766526 RepID=UPI0032D97D43
MTPSDPLFTLQWHLMQIGNIREIWDDYTGSGVIVGVYDDGVQYAHWDLDDNYDSSLHVTVGGVVYDGDTHDVQSAGHGTSVAGLIGAEANGQGTVGVAFGATIGSVNIFDPNSNLFINASNPTGFFDAVRESATFDVVNNSWGASPGYFDFSNENVAGSFAQQTLAGWEYSVDNGRGGLGTVVVKSAGNSNENSNGDSLNASRFTITVAASRDDGNPSSYSSNGANVLVSGHAGDFASLGGLGIVTTDLLGTGGYNLRSDNGGNYDYTDGFGGTSAAAPIVTGVVTLMLEANSGLGWRDVKDILAASATHQGSAIGAPSNPYEDHTWFFNQADTWNGGGMHFSEDHGYGMVNAYNAVRMAEVWSLFDAPQTSANEQSASASASPGITISGTHVVSLNLAASIEIDYLSVTLTLTHSYFNDLDVFLTSAEGTQIQIVDRPPTATAADSGLTWTFGVEALRGELSNGDWTLTIVDNYVAADTGTLTSWTVTAYGKTPDANDVFHFTDDFRMVSGLSGEAGRRTVSDTDGGTDWINAAAVSTDVIINLHSGFYSSVAGSFFRVDVGTVIENVVSGDGDDYLIGNQWANELRGMRGDDLIDGRSGADLMYGGRGNDIYIVDDAGDQVFEVVSEGVDTIRTFVNLTLADNVERLEMLGTASLRANGNSANNTMVGNVGDNLINGAAGNDYMVGGAGNDIYIVGSLGDRVVEFVGEGIDTVRSWIDWVLGDHLERLELFGTAASATGNALNNTLVGTSGANLLNGGSGNDYMAGGAGNDIYIVGSINDTVIEMAGGGVDTVRAWVDLTLADNVERLELMGSTVSGTGNALDNTIVGNDANNVLNGATGDDYMVGGGGNDLYVVGSIGDRTIEAAGQGIDTVRSWIDWTLSNHVERLELQGSASTSARGNALNNTIVGNSAANVIDGEWGNDFLVGGGGNDVFVFDTPLSPSANVDRIADFTSGQDRILLDDSVFTTLAVGSLDPNAFRIGTSAADASDRIIYDQASGSIFYDADGVGGASGLLFARVNAGSAMSASDFLVA